MRQAACFLFSSLSCAHFAAERPGADFLFTLDDRRRAPSHSHGSSRMTLPPLMRATGERITMMMHDDARDASHDDLPSARHGARARPSRARFHIDFLRPNSQPAPAEVQLRRFSFRATFSAPASMKAPDIIDLDGVASFITIRQKLIFV